MKKEVLAIENLAVKVEGANILNGVDLTVNTGEIHAIMGPNGSGKSTFAQVIAGSPSYSIDRGNVRFNGKEIAGMDPDERARLGIFLSFQYPLEIPGVNVASFLRMIHNKKTGENMPPVKFRAFLEEKMKVIDMKSDFTERYLNQGFSGGEKKRMEILQMLVLEPRLIILDEVDSGLDIDALRSVARGVNYLCERNPDTSLIIITHYARILEHIKPGFVHVMHNGKIVRSGGIEVAQKLEKEGYREFGEEDIEGLEVARQDTIKL